MKLHPSRLGAPAVRQPFGGFDDYPGHRRFGFELGKPDAFDSPVGGQVPQNLGGFVHRYAGELYLHLEISGLTGPGGFELAGAAGGKHHRPVFGNRNGGKPAVGQKQAGRQGQSNKKTGCFFHISLG